MLLFSIRCLLVFASIGMALLGFSIFIGTNQNREPGRQTKNNKKDTIMAYVVQQINPIPWFRKKLLFRYSSLICEICVEPKLRSEFLSIKGCVHSFCHDCMAKYVASRIQENVISIRCPELDCLGVLEPEICRSILPEEVFARWTSALCEPLILEGQRLYYPYKDCSALLINDGGIGVKETECPHCRRMFCVQCKVPWHSGIKCKKSHKGVLRKSLAYCRKSRFALFLGIAEKERESVDTMMMKLVKNKKWQRCPKCNFYVEKSGGCSHMKCRCGFDFCYKCAAPLKNNRYSCKCKL